MRYICDCSNFNIYDSPFKVYFDFITKYSMDNVRSISLRFPDESDEFRLSLRYYAPNIRYHFKAEVIMEHSFVTLTSADFPLNIEVTLWVDKPNDPEFLIPGYNTPVILSIPAPSFPDSDINPPSMPPVTVTVQYDGDGHFSIA